ncbi:hypothetical protein B0T21DRAFT_358051 [Apiosordaria backusii]|uniref:Uncharacterized protein n=1 Tax=Apiosordaria backusii TaxID=314023 RepID=A0AA40ESB6_9PEZI|nr:hypothetical protein B0T21DRAFT_358051 [Apiosordaria backusii]
MDAIAAAMMMIRNFGVIANLNRTGIGDEFLVRRQALSVATLIHVFWYSLVLLGSV